MSDGEMSGDEEESEDEGDNPFARREFYSSLSVS